MITKARSLTDSFPLGVVGLWCLLTVGCAASASASASSSAADASPPPADAAPAIPPAPPTPAAKLVFALEGVGLSHPEAVIYDAQQDVYFVSNVNGDPGAKDKNGFISKVSPDGQVLELKFIDGSLTKTLLDAPKGMTISGDLLYVADLNHVRVFDRKSGVARGQLHGAGTTFLNGVSVTETGTVLVTDSGWKSGPTGFTNTGSDALLKIDPKKVKVEITVKDATLGNPNGIVATKDGVLVVNWLGELYDLTKDNKKGTVTKLPKTMLDGIVLLADGTLLISSWEGKAIYKGKAGGTFTPIVVEMNSPAAIGFDSKRNRLLVPGMMDDRVLCLELTGAADAPPLSAPAPGTSPKPVAPAPAATPAAPGAPVAAGGAAAVASKPGAATPATPATPATASKPAAVGTAATPAKPATPTTPAKPGATPATPATPAKPGAPAAAGAAVGTAAAKPGATPATPATPAKPATPATPAKAATPATPATPAKAATPATAAVPAKAATPATPAKPATATTPATPAKAATPATPATPAKAATPATPATPAKPATPATPAKPATPATPATPAKPATPATPAKPAGSATVKTP